VGHIILPTGKAVSHIRPTYLVLLAHSKNELIPWRGVRRLSVCKLLRKSLLLTGKWPDRHQTCTRWTPGQHASRICSRSKVTWYGHFCAGRKIASSPRKMAGSRPNLQRIVSRWTYIQGVLKVKVKVKGHVICALSWILGMSYSVIDGLVYKSLAALVISH